MPDAETLIKRQEALIKAQTTSICASILRTIEDQESSIIDAKEIINKCFND
jgi:hypothetical protein